MAKETIVAIKPHRNIHARKKKEAKTFYIAARNRIVLFSHVNNFGFLKKAKSNYGVVPTVTKLDTKYLILPLKFPFKARIIELTRCLVTGDLVSHSLRSDSLLCFSYFMRLLATSVADTL